MILLKQKYSLYARVNKYLLFALYYAFVFLFSSCETWSETSEVSHISYLPEFEILGEEFQSYVVVDSAEYEDDGALASSNGVSLKVLVYGEVDLTEVGVYTIIYYAENSDGIGAIAERIIAVTHNDVSENDLSGKYEGANFSVLIEMKVSKLHSDGYYKCDDIMGYSDADMSGKFVDLGNHELYLLHGEGDFGNYAYSEGEYTLSALAWNIILLDKPYEGVNIPVYWRRVKE